jgi:hypothetical protein
MGLLTPLATSFVIIVLVFGTGAFIAYFRDRRKFRGYEELMSDSSTMVNLVNGEVFRDGDDLVVAGNTDGLPTYIRFSHAETTPGLHIRMEAPANVRLLVAPRSAPMNEEGAVVKSGEESLDVRCVMRSTEPMQGKLFVGSKSVIAELQKLICSSRTYFSVAPGAMEISELTIPEGNVGKHVSDHVAAMRRLVPELEKLPGAEKINIRPIKRDRNLVLKAAIAVGIVAVVMAVSQSTRHPQAADAAPGVATKAAPEGVLFADTDKIAGLNDWRVATEADFESDAAGWVKGFRKTASGRVSGRFNGAQEGLENAYVLINDEGTRRLVVMMNGENRYDVKYPYIGVLAMVPRGNFVKIDWVGGKADKPDGDGILILRKPQDRSSGLILYFSEGRLTSGVPVNYQTVDLME